MKLTRFQNTITIVVLGLSILGGIGGATWLQLLPFGAFFGLVYGHTKKDMSVYIMSLGFIMAAINLYSPSTIDIFLWLLVVLAWK